MKKQTLAKGLLPFLLCAGCYGQTPVDSSKENSSSSSEETNAQGFQKALSLLGKGYSLEGSVSQRTDKGLVGYLVDVEVNADNYSYVRYATSEANVDPDKKSVFAREHYLRDTKNNLAATATLDISNKVIYSYLANEETSSYLSWEEAGYSNGFAALSEASFEQDSSEKSVYRLKMGDEENANAISYLSVQLFGSRTVSLLSSFSLTFENGAITGYEGTLAPIGVSSQERILKGRFLASGETIQIENSVKPVEGKEDQKFVDLMESLKKHNYVLTDYYWGMTGDETMTELTTPTISVIESDAKSLDIQTYTASTVENPSIDPSLLTSHNAYIDQGEGMVSLCNVIEGSYYQDGALQKGAVTSLLPSFDISSLFFTYNEKTKTYIYDNVNARGSFCYSNTYSPYSPSYSMLGRCEIVLGDDGSVTFNTAYAYPASIESTTYSKIGQVETIADKVSVKTDTSSLTTIQMLSNHKQALEGLKKAFGSEEAVNAIPLLGGSHSLVGLYHSDESDYYAIEYRIRASVIGEYAGKLEENGFARATGVGAYLSGDLYTKDLTVDGTSYRLTLEIKEDLVNYGTFGIVPTLAKR